jgi:hypothetical protein
MKEILSSKISMNFSARLHGLSAFFIVTGVKISNLIDTKYLFELFEVSEYFSEYNGNRM